MERCTEDPLVLVDGVWFFEGTSAEVPTERTPDKASAEAQRQPKRKPAQNVKASPRKSKRAKPAVAVAVDDGRRPDTHVGRVSDSTRSHIRVGDLCYLCYKPTEDTDYSCARPVRGCSLSFHQECYETTWHERTYNKCPCRHCMVCTKSEMHTRCVGTCECGVDLHVDYAKALDFYCIVCKAPVWPLDG